MNPSNGVTYSNDTGGLKRSLVVAASSEGLADDDGATWLLKTTFLAATEASPNGQVNLSLGRECNELWFEWRYLCPDNYAHRNGPSTDNNKFLVAYKSPYSSGWHQAGLELERGTAPADSGMKPMMRFTQNDGNGGLAGVYMRIQAGLNDAVVSDNGPIVPGTWNTVRWYAKKSSAIGATNGVWKLWVNGVLLKGWTNLLLGPSDPLKFDSGFDSFYFFGTANSGYDTTTVFYTRYLKLYDTDPGWV